MPKPSAKLQSLFTVISDTHSAYKKITQLPDLSKRDLKANLDMLETEQNNLSKAMNDEKETDSSRAYLAMAFLRAFREHSDVDLLVNGQPSAEYQELLDKLSNDDLQISTLIKDIDFDDVKDEDYPADTTSDTQFDDIDEYDSKPEVGLLFAVPLTTEVVTAVVDEKIVDEKRNALNYKHERMLLEITTYIDSFQQEIDNLGVIILSPLLLNSLQIRLLTIKQQVTSQNLSMRDLDYLDEILDRFKVEIRELRESAIENLEDIVLTHSQVMKTVHTLQEAFALSLAEAFVIKDNLAFAQSLRESCSTLMNGLRLLLPMQNKAAPVEQKKDVVVQAPNIDSLTLFSFLKAPSAKVNVEKSYLQDVAGALRRGKYEEASLFLKEVSYDTRMKIGEYLPRLREEIVRAAKECNEFKLELTRNDPVHLKQKIG